VLDDVEVPPRRVPRAAPLPPIARPAPIEPPGPAAPAPIAPPAADLEPVAAANDHGEPERFELDIELDDMTADAVTEAPAPPPEAEQASIAPPAPAPAPSVEKEDPGLGSRGIFDDLTDDSIAAPLTVRHEPSVAVPVWAPAAETGPEPAAEVVAAPEAAFSQPDMDGDDAEDDLEEDEDPFIAELRRAITDTQPLGPREEGDVRESHEEDLVHGDVLDGSRLGSLLRRRR
jgi:hypothetical protein